MILVQNTLESTCGPSTFQLQQGIVYHYVQTPAKILPFQIESVAQLWTLFTNFVQQESCSVYFPVKFQKHTHALLVVCSNRWLQNYAPVGRPRSSKNISSGTYAKKVPPIQKPALPSLKAIDNGKLLLTSMVTLNSKCHTPDGSQKDELSHPTHRPNSILGHHVSYLQTVPGRQITTPSHHSSFGHRIANTYHSPISLLPQSIHCLEHLEYTLIWVQNEDESPPRFVLEDHTSATIPILPLPGDKRPKLHHLTLSHALSPQQCACILLTKAGAPHWKNASTLATVTGNQFPQPSQPYYTNNSHSMRVAISSGKNKWAHNNGQFPCAVELDTIYDNTSSTPPYALLPRDYSYYGLSLTRFSKYTSDLTRTKPHTKIQLLQRLSSHRLVQTILKGLISRECSVVSTIKANPRPDSFYNCLRLKNPLPKLTLSSDLIIPGQLYGGGHFQTPPTDQDNIYVYPTSLLTNTGPLCISRIPRSHTITWKPAISIPHCRSDHILDNILTDTILERIKWSCQQPAQNIIVYSKGNNKIFITTTQLCNLVENGKSINDEIMHLFLETIGHTINIPFLCSQFLPLLRRNGWNKVIKYFAPSKTHLRRTLYKPGIIGESAMAIPCFIHGCHWVAAVRREIQGRVIFFYSDDLNDNFTELIVKNLLQNTNKDFYPDNAEWINCGSITYLPHFNECGPRTAFALTVLMIHPSPHKDMLMEFMHPNLSQILHTWMASAILSGEVYFPPLDPPTSNQSTNMTSKSSPSSLITWNSTTSEATPNNIHEGILPAPLSKPQNCALRKPLSPIIDTLPEKTPQTTKAKPNLPHTKVKISNLQNNTPVTSPLHQFIKRLDSSHQQHITATQPTISVGLLQGLPKISISNKKPSSAYQEKRSSPTENYSGLSWIQ
jgi:hypothetical protein